MTLEENEIIQELRAFPPSEVYYVAPQRSVRLGFEYYREGRLTGYQWTQGGAALTAFVRGTRRYSVVFSIEEGALSSSCNCPAWTASSNGLGKGAATSSLENGAATCCKHVVCALLNDPSSERRRAARPSPFEKMETALILRGGRRRSSLRSFLITAATLSS